MPLAPSSSLPVRGDFPLLASPKAYFERNPALVASNAVVTLDDGLERLLQEVNSEVNRNAWVPEDGDHWDDRLPGDCENFALQKRRRLGEAGLELGALRVCVGRVPRLGHHAVLHVVTEAGDYVLDNLNDDVLPWRESLHVPVWRTGGKDGAATKEIYLPG